MVLKIVFGFYGSTQLNPEIKKAAPGRLL